MSNFKEFYFKDSPIGELRKIKVVVMKLVTLKLLAAEVFTLPAKYEINDFSMSNVDREKLPCYAVVPFQFFDDLEKWFDAFSEKEAIQHLEMQEKILAANNKNIL